MRSARSTLVTGALRLERCDDPLSVQADGPSRLKALFAEVRVPLLKDTPGAHLLEVSGAVRHEFYSDTTNPTVPKITVRYLPFNDEFALRGTYSRSFTAPTLFELFGPNSIGFTPSYNLLPAGATVALPNTQNNSESGSNPQPPAVKVEELHPGLRPLAEGPQGLLDLG